MESRYITYIIDEENWWLNVIKTIVFVIIISLLSGMIIFNIFFVFFMGNQYDFTIVNKYYFEMVILGIFKFMKMLWNNIFF